MSCFTAAFGSCYCPAGCWICTIFINGLEWIFSNRWMSLTKAGLKVSSVYVDINKTMFFSFVCNCSVYSSLSSSEMCLWDNLMDLIRAHQNVFWFLFRISLWGFGEAWGWSALSFFVDRPWTEFAILWLSSLALSYRDHFKKQWQPNPTEKKPSNKALWSHSNPMSEENPNNYETN